MEVLEVWKAVYFLLHVVAQNLKKKIYFLCIHSLITTKPFLRLIFISSSFLCLFACLFKIEISVFNSRIIKL